LPVHVTSRCSTGAAPSRRGSASVPAHSGFLSSVSWASPLPGQPTTLGSPSIALEPRRRLRIALSGESAIGRIIFRQVVAYQPLFLLSNTRYSETRYLIHGRLDWRGAPRISSRAIFAPFDNICGPDGAHRFFEYGFARVRYIQQHPQDAVIKLAQEGTLFTQ
jgi:hypothetical protein